MELTQLRYFLQVYHMKNICTASVQLNVSQQAVSKQIQKLEDELGVALFERNPRGVQATAYGDLLAQKVEHFLPELDAFVYGIQRKNTVVAGVVHLGIQCWQMSVEHGLKYDVLHDFERAYPSVHLVWENSIPKRCLEGLRTRDLNLAVMVMPEDPEGFELTPLRRFEWFMLMSKKHPLAGREQLSVHDLAGQRLILANNESGTRNRIRQKLEGAEKPIFVGVDDFIFDLIGQQIEGEGAMMLTTETSLDQYNPEKFVMIPLRGDLWRTQLYLARISGAAQTPAEQALYQFLLEHWRE